MELTKEQLFAMAFPIENPWYVESIKLDEAVKRFNIEVNFNRDLKF